MEAEEPEIHTPASTDSATISTRSGHPPGTPKSPISPPRRRSSLAFSRVFNCTSPTNDSDEPESPQKTTDLPRRTPSNTSRKRMPASVHRNTVTPGHVAHMQQRLLHSAKAALRVDMAFAASPTGSIGSRLPPDSPASPAADSEESPASADLTPNKGWRFSMAPQIIAGLDHDVREPVDEGSPTLPDALPPNEDDGDMLGIEPISSGFTSPVNCHNASVGEDVNQLPALPSSPPLGQGIEDDDISPVAITGSDLEGPMTELKVCSDDELADIDTDESPIVSHLKRMPDEPPVSTEGIVEDKEDIVLSGPARAAAESAKAKRGLLRSLFPRKENKRSTMPTEVDRCDREPSETPGTPCPDPALHRLIARGECPDPAAHLRHPSPLMIPPGLSVTPEAAIGLSQYMPSPVRGAWYPPPRPFHRATATGSPMPFARTRSRPSSQEETIHYPRQSHYSHPSVPHAPPQPARPHRSGTKSGHPAPAMETEHFQPGWYYARESSKHAEEANLKAYSFSTAAAKVEGQSTAPESRIRDSYRTDTLTPLARPPHRFRKTGINASAANRGVNRFYNDHERDDRPPSRRRSGTGHNHRMHDNVQFRSSPPRHTQRMQSQHKRRRPREFEDENVAVRADEAASQPRLEKDESPMEVDDETRAAVRLSIFGPNTPEALHGSKEGLKELSPNVTSWRKGMKQPSKKKRRPSYWDGDLKQVRNSAVRTSVNRSSGISGREVVTSPPEAMVQHGGPERRVCTSPAKEEIENVEEHTGVIGYDGASIEAGVTSAGEDNRSFVTGEERKDEVGDRMEVDGSI